MLGMLAQKQGKVSGDLFDRIGTFLADQRLSIDPVNYAFAHHILTQPDGPIANAVARLTDGGVRLLSSDIESLGAQVKAGVPNDAPEEDTGPSLKEQAQQLVANTSLQVDGFTSMVRAMHDETRGFGRDLAQSAAAMSGAPGIEDIARITGEMLGRINEAETRLANATVEAEALRSKLAEATDTARRDALTGLLNRRALEEAFANRNPADGPYCLAVCDIDRFKRVNDDHGHAVGDRVLSAVGKSLAEYCSDHVVVRYGGEEFAILMSGIDLMAAARLLDDAREMIGNKRFRNRETDKPLGSVTISIGVTAVQPDERHESAFERADRLLYTAKANGRDQVSVA
jgi:diguanylate cyclase